MRIIIFSWHFLGVCSALWGLATGAFPSSVQIGELEMSACVRVRVRVGGGGYWHLRTDTRM